MLCPTCERGIGVVTVYRNGSVIRMVCPTCEGIGALCNRCGGNPAHCDCDEDDKGNPRCYPQSPGHN